MLDFVQIRTATRALGRGGCDGEVVTVYPEFIVGRTEDLMTRGRDFYAVWDEDSGFWTKDPSAVARIVDAVMRDKRDEFPEDVNVEVKWMASYSTKKWDEFLSYCRSLPDSYHELDSEVVFANDEVHKEDYATKKLPYAMKAGDMPAYEELVSTLYDPVERRKLEWAIGAVISGDSKRIQKFLVLYGSAGSGKSTMLNIVQMLFDGYYNVFEAKALTSASNNFALEMFRDNPLVSIQHDGDLSRIEDNTKLNSIVSHEQMVVNEKRKTQYTAYFRTFLFMGTNKPVKITDVKSGVVRRLIDVKPSGNTVPFARYQVLMAQIRFELGAIAAHCLKQYREQGGMDAYSAYRPTEMMGATNDFFNFVEDNFDIFKQDGGTTLAQAWALYKRWSDEAAVKYPMSRRAVKEELKGYFKEYSERVRTKDGGYQRNVYKGFRMDRLSSGEGGRSSGPEPSECLVLDGTSSAFDRAYSGQPAQLASKDGTPMMKWSEVKTTLADIDTSELHYVQVPEDHIVIDFDLQDESGEKDLEANLRAAAKWPTTYAELSRSGKGVHLHYIYDGDVSKLAPEYSEHVEIKVQKGNSALRRRLTRCNSEQIATLSSGLPLKKGGKDKVIDFNGFKNEKALRTLVERNLRKEIHPGTKPSIDFIDKILDEAYSSGMRYDLTDMRNDVAVFANNSTHWSSYCMSKVANMKFKSEEDPEDADWDRDDIIFYDVEVFPNLFVVVWKRQGDYQPVKMINPTPSDVEILMRYKLVGFNNRRYDNHILYARLLGESNEGLYHRSQQIVNGSRNAMYGAAYGISYADIYDFASVKQSLKKWEIELGIHHLELGLPWDEPVPENLWDKVADYCVNDVLATEAVFEARKEDFEARRILAELSGLRVNDTTRMHATKIIFGGEKNPQKDFVYTDLSEMFPGYTYEYGKSLYCGEEVGEGGYVYAEPGMYKDVALLDIASMHPTSIIQLNLFGDVYTKRYADLLEARLAVKHRDFEKAAKMLDGKLAPYLSEDTADALAYSLKIICNSVYGYTKASFDCEFRDERNVDNIVAKRGALFMVDLKRAIQEKGYTVAHIKTDSVKIPDADEEIISFVMEFGKKYGYTFEHEATYSRLCLVNNAVYICKDAGDGHWSATGAQFAVPYVFKSLFSHEPLELTDFAETRSVTAPSVMYLDMNEKLEEGEHNYVFIGRAGQFCPILPGRGGGKLLREKEGRYYAVTGTKDFRWLEFENVAQLDKQGDIDISYYDKLADEAKKTISEFGDFNDFVKEADNG